MCLTGCDLTRSDSNHVLTAHDVCVNVLATIFDIVVVQMGSIAPRVLEDQA